MLDVLDAAAVRAVVAAARPDAIIYQATALTGISFSRNMDRALRPDQPAAHRRAPTTCSPPPARPACRRFIAQSFAPFRYAHTGGPVKDENDPC